MRGSYKRKDRRARSQQPDEGGLKKSQKMSRCQGKREIRYSVGTLDSQARRQFHGEAKQKWKNEKFFRVALFL